jgi:hypothetical protein
MEETEATVPDVSLFYLQKTGQLFNSKVSENTSIDIEDWGF